MTPSRETGGPPVEQVARSILEEAMIGGQPRTAAGEPIVTRETTARCQQCGRQIEARLEGDGQSYSGMHWVLPITPDGLCTSCAWAPGTEEGPALTPDRLADWARGEQP